jgi:uncharacterized protein YbjT (DUF2867 family)
MIIALTGGTGFVGGQVIKQALAAGHQLRALTRKVRPEQVGVSWIAGDLGNTTALAELLTGADVVLHVAGETNAPDRAGFATANIAGTAAMVQAAEAGGVKRFIHVSSLAAREPKLSDYCWSKAGAEAAVKASDLDWAMVRPPAIYGPGDQGLYPLFKAAKFGLVPMPPRARMGVIHVGNLAELLLILCTTDPLGRMIYEVDDGDPAMGWDNRDFAKAIGRAVGKSIFALNLPPWLLAVAGMADRKMNGPRASLSKDRVRYFCHPDWLVSPSLRPPARLWTPRLSTAAGLADTVSWYRGQGML